MSTDKQERKNVEQLLQDYLAAFSNTAESSVNSCFSEHAVVDFPMINPAKFCGLREIGRAHELAFENLTMVELRITELVAKDDVAMGSGKLSVNCRGETETHTFAVTAHRDDGKLRRLSWFIDARKSRLWSDQSVL